MTPEPLAPRQTEAMRFVQGYTLACGVPPSIRELAAAMGTAPLMARKNLEALERKGWIRRTEPGRSRNLEILWWVTPDGSAYRPVNGGDES